MNSMLLRGGIKGECAQERAFAQAKSRLRTHSEIRTFAEMGLSEYADFAKSMRIRGAFYISRLHPFTGREKKSTQSEIRIGRMADLAFVSDVPGPLSFRRVLRSQNYQSRFREFRIGRDIFRIAVMSPSR